MRQGMTLTELTAEVYRQAGAKRDFLAASPQVIMEDGGQVWVGENGPFGITEHGHAQLAERLEIPKRYYDRLRLDSPDLLQRNVNHWLQRSAEPRMIRTLDGNVRAVLSNRYRRRDNYDLARAVIPLLSGSGLDLSVGSANVTETSFYLKVTTPRITGTVRGQVVQSGVWIRNSEVGAGSLRVDPLIYILSCLNGAVMEQFSKKSYHVGRAAELESEAYELYSDSTLELDDASFWAKVKDTVQAVLNPQKFALMISSIEERAGDPITNPTPAVRMLQQRIPDLGEHDTEKILEHFLTGGDLTRWGLSNAVTRHSQDVTDYDRASSLEVAGGKILTLSGSEWSTLANAA